MISFSTVMFTLVLCSEFSAYTVCQAIPTGKLEDGRTDLDSLNSILDEEVVSDPALHGAVFSQRPILDDGLGDEDGTRKIIILSDIGEKRHSRRGLSPAFARAAPLLPERSADHTPLEYSLKIDRREADLDMLRCMIGRVYRPCWQS